VTMVCVLDDSVMRCDCSTRICGLGSVLNDVDCCCIVDRQECCRDSWCRDGRCVGRVCCSNCGDGFPDLLCVSGRVVVVVEVKDVEDVTRYIGDVERKFENFRQRYRNVSSYMLVITGRVDEQLVKRRLRRYNPSIRQAKSVEVRPCS